MSMPRKASVKPPPSPEYHGENRYSYIVNADLKSEEKDVLVRREKWRDSRYHTSARDSKGHFIATKRWGKHSTIKSFEYKYISHPITLRVTSKKKYNMSSERNQKIIFNELKRKYSKYPLRDARFTYRYTYDSNTGIRL